MVEVGGYMDVERKCYAIKFSGAASGVLSEGHHARLLGVICREGKANDALRYMQRRPDLPQSLHAMAIDLFRKDTYNGPMCAAEYPVVGLTPENVDGLLGAIFGGVEVSTRAYAAWEFVSRSKDVLLPRHFERIVVGLEESGCFRYTRICKQMLAHTIGFTPDQRRRVAAVIAAAGADVADEEIGLPPFDVSRVEC
jgi:hypothetical protein